MRRIPYQPAEGWLAVVLVAIMSLTIGWSLDDPGWVQGNHDWTDYLPLAALLGAAADSGSRSCNCWRRSRPTGRRRSQSPSSSRSAGCGAA